MQRETRWALAVSLAVALAVVAISAFQPKVYEADAQVSVIERVLGTVDGVKTHLVLGAGIDPRITTIIESPDVARITLKRLHLPKSSTARILENLNATEESGTSFIDLTYTDQKPQRAKQVLNTVGRVTHDATRNHKFVAYLWRPATVPTTPIRPRPIRNGVVAFVVVLALSELAITIRSQRTFLGLGNM